MPTLSQPPPPLAQAIQNAASSYGVPSDLLAGIWRIESGARYPNPYVNSKGYGGLFGTSNGLASTQAQADEAASVLRAGLVASHGNVAEALSYYNSGKLQGGYTSVPGQTTVGTVGLLPSKKGANPNTGFGATNFGPGTAGAGIGSAVSGAVGGVESVGSFLGKLTDPNIILRTLQVIAGGLLLGAGLVLLARQVALAADLPDPVKAAAGPAGAAASAVTERPSSRHARQQPTSRESARDAAPRTTSYASNVPTRRRPPKPVDDIPF